MSDGLLRLVYVSTAVAAVDQAALQAILAPSKVRNGDAGITGVLCAGRGHFLQVLEGSERRVMSLYLKIAADTRHRDARLLSIALVGERLFGEWAMAHIDSASHSAVAHEVLLAEQELRVRNDAAPAILRRFVAELKGSRVATVGGKVAA